HERRVALLVGAAQVLGLAVARAQVAHEPGPAVVLGDALHAAAGAVAAVADAAVLLLGGRRAQVLAGQLAAAGGGITDLARPAPHLGVVVGERAGRLLDADEAHAIAGLADGALVRVRAGPGRRQLAAAAERAHEARPAVLADDALLPEAGAQLADLRGERAAPRDARAVLVTLALVE